MPRLLRLARCQGYGSFASGCGGMWFAFRHRSPAGGSTLMTSAPKSDKITAALGPAMKLGKSTTFSPEKMLSLAMIVSTELLGPTHFHHRPWNRGARFSRHAVVPSFLSPVA